MKKILKYQDGIELNKMTYPDGSGVIYVVRSGTRLIPEKTFKKLTDAVEYFDVVLKNSSEN